MKHNCEVCGERYEDRWMMSYNSGLKKHWFCWECWKAGQGEAAAVEVRRKHERKKELMKRK